MNVIYNAGWIFLLISIFSFSKAEPPKEDPRIRELLNKCHAKEEDGAVVLKFQVPSTDTGKCLMQCFLKELKMLDSNQKYDEPLGLIAFKNFWAMHNEDILKEVNSKAAKLELRGLRAKDIDSKSDTCEYGYEIMKFINAEFVKKLLLTTQTPVS